MSLGLTGSESNKNLFNNVDGGVLNSGGKIPGSRGFKIASRKGILSRKSSVNKNSFYKQKTKETLPNKLYGNGNSYFNKNSGSGNQGLPGLNSGGGGGIGANPSSGLGKYKPTAGGQGYKYGGGGGIGGGIGGGTG